MVLYPQIADGTDRLLRCYSDGQVRAQLQATEAQLLAAMRSETSAVEERLEEERQHAASARLAAQQREQHLEGKWAHGTKHYASGHCYAPFEDRVWLNMYTSVNGSGSSWCM